MADQTFGQTAAGGSSVQPASGQMVFARKASGLVRGLSVTDAFGVGFMNQGITVSMWLMMSMGLSVYTGGNLIIATLLSGLLCGIGFPLVWGILGGSMPRSGGEYIYNSRILHPIIGIAESFGNAFVWIMWIFVLAPWAVDPGMVMLFQFLGMPDVAAWFQTPVAVFAFASLVNFLALLFLVFGMKVFAMAQKIIMSIAIFGLIVIMLALTFVSHDSFVTIWNNFAAQFGSLNYDAFLQAASTAMADAGTPIKSTWNWFDTLGVMVAGFAMFAYSYCITFIAGEVKRPDKTIILGNFFAILVPTFFMLWLSVVMYRLVGFEMTTATAWVDYQGELAGYTMPWLPNFIGMAAMIIRSPILIFIMSLSFILFNFWYIALSYMAFPRILFAWGMDRMGPKWFTDINYRFSTPVKNHIVCFIFGELGIIAYALIGDRVAALGVQTMEIVSVFGVTTLAAILFPYLKKVRPIWEASPYKNWKIFGIPVVVFGGIISLIYLGIAFFFYVIMPNYEEFTLTTLGIYTFIWLLGVLWYFFWKRRNSDVGIDVTMTYGELPPD